MVAASLDGVPERGTVASEVEKRGSMGMGKKMCGVAAEVLRDATCWHKRWWTQGSGMAALRWKHLRSSAAR